MNQEQFNKIRQYLLEQGQQELVGHLDGFKQEYDQATSTDTPSADNDTPAQDDEESQTNPPAPADEPAETPSEPQTTAQQFQDQARQKVAA